MNKMKGEVKALIKDTMETMMNKVVRMIMRKTLMKIIQMSTLKKLQNQSNSISSQDLLKKVHMKRFSM